MRREVGKSQLSRELEERNGKRTVEMLKRGMIFFTDECCIVPSHATAVGSYLYGILKQLKHGDVRV